MTSESQWRAELAIWLAVDIAVSAAFWIGAGPLAGLISGAVSLLVTAAVHLGRRQMDAARIAGGVGDERVRSLSVHANSMTATVLWAVITPWWLVTVALGEQDLTLLMLVVVQATTFLGSSIYLSRRS